MDEARREVEAGLALDPAFSVRRFRGGYSDNAIYLVQQERVVDGLRKAGAPEE
jgi:hypothetical protein